MGLPDDSSSLREVISRTLRRRDAGAVADATLATWRLIAAQVEPIIGARGVDVLLRRVLHLVSAAYPDLAITGESELLTTLEARLAVRDVDSATAAASTLLATFCEVLGSMVGESLTERLLRPIWALSTSEPERT
jgi:hypothetical protein